MDLAQLEVFLAVAREGKFSRAAEKLHRTQSAVSQSIHKLEEGLGELLFDRSSRDGRLTDAGRRAKQTDREIRGAIVTIAQACLRNRHGCVTPPRRTCK